MPCITFIYKVGQNPKTYYGKYCVDYISDDHEGLDLEVKNVLINGLNKYRQQNNIQRVKSKNVVVGVLSFSSDRVIPIYFTNKEIKCFDFYHDYNNKIYVNGKLI
jgi:hypothetical protein